MRVNAAGIDGAHATARDGSDVEAPIFAAGREQLNGIARPDLEYIGESVADNHAGRVVPKVVERAIDNLLGQIRRAQMRGRINSKKIGRGRFESRACANCSVKHGRAGDNIGKLPADSHEFADVRDSFEIISVRRRVARRPGRDDHSFITRLKSRTQNQRAVAANG